MSSELSNLRWVLVDSIITQGCGFPCPLAAAPPTRRALCQIWWPT